MHMAPRAGWSPDPYETRARSWMHGPAGCIITMVSPIFVWVALGPYMHECHFERYGWQAASRKPDLLVSEQLLL